MESCIPLTISQSDINDVSQKAVDWALLHGAVMRRKNNFSEQEVSFAPFTLLPSVYKRDQFDNVVKLQTSVNELIHRVAYDHEFLESALKYTIESDDFTRRLYDIYKLVRMEGPHQSFSLGILRTDYLPHYDDQLKQVEMNTIACSFSSISNIISRLHRFTLSELNHRDKLNNLPTNTALNDVSSGICRAWEMFGNYKSVILFLVEEVTYNIADQRFIEYAVGSCPGNPKVIRRSLTYISKHATFNNNHDLILDGHVVGLVYMRVGYDPCQYVSQGEWSARFLIERSTAIKCPTIQMHLAGTKKVQQKLAEPGVLDKFIKDNGVSKTFTGIYSLDKNDEGDAAVDMAVKNPAKFVLKPQREGGGHNIYGDQVREKLESMTAKERQGYILMERIEPPERKNILVRHAGVTTESVISELGIFGVIIGNNEKIVHNASSGHMLRTKPRDVDEGGVAAGFGALDSPFLV